MYTVRFVNGKMTYRDLDEYLTELGYSKSRTEASFVYRHDNGSVITIPKGRSNQLLEYPYYRVVRIELTNFGFSQAVKDMALVG